MDRGILGREYGDGEIICRQGEIGDRMYVLQSGRAVVLHEENGFEYTVGELKGGDLFGEMSIFSNEPRSATVRVKEGAWVLSLDKRAFMRQVHEDPSLAYRLLQGMSLRIWNLDRRLSQNNVWPAKSQADPSVRFLFIVARDQPGMYETLLAQFAEERDIRVLVDRREGDRRSRAKTAPAERRRATRRRYPKKSRKA